LEAIMTYYFSKTIEMPFAQAVQHRLTVAVAPEAAAEATEQEDDKDDYENGSKRHETFSLLRSPKSHSSPEAIGRRSLSNYMPDETQFN
jgi:hypothetical protein